MTSPRISLPKKGISKASVLKTMRNYGSNDANYKNARTWSLVYYLGEEHTQFLQKAYQAYFSENGLSPMAFASLKRFESEVVRMTADLLRGDDQVVGTMTSGGTESCLLAVKTYRDLAKSRRLFPGKPEMIAPESVHVAFEKAAEYFDVKMVHAPLDSDKRVKVKAVKKLINRNTAMIVASAPCYPFGVVDPIAELGQLAKKKNIPFHVDSCLGGFLLPFVEKLGYVVPTFDFRIPGVTSISADVHKYGYSAKGASTLLYRDQKFLKHQIFVYENWPGGIFASAGLLGTRPGGAIAAAWAAMQSLGEDGYMRHAKTIMQTTEKLIEGINAIPKLEVIGKPHMSVFAYTSKSADLDIFAVGELMEQKGWHLDRQQKPESLHAMVTPLHQEIADQYLSDLRESVEYVMQHPELAQQGGAAMYGMIANIPLRSMIKKKMLEMMLEMYGPQMKMPELSGSDQEDDIGTKVGMMYLQLREKARRILGQ